MKFRIIGQSNDSGIGTHYQNYTTALKQIGGINQILEFINFQDTSNSLETQINSIKLNPIFILAIIITIIYFYIILNIQIYNKNKTMYLFLLTIISITIIGIPFLILFKKYLKKKQTKE
jgi:heme/copper-type cytochrome/quinol oxidase subunit 4